jgi:hypothetical protein
MLWKQYVVGLCMCVFAGVAWAEEAPLYTQNINGLYPVWDTTGYVLPCAAGRIGWSNVQFGIADIGQIGVHPVPFAFRTPNFQIKAKVFQKNKWHVAVQVSPLVFLRGASTSFASPQYASRLSNPDHTIVALPVQASATWEATKWFKLHNTLTVMGFFAGKPFKNSASVGHFVTAQFVAHRSHDIFLHAAEIGFWKHDMAIVGASYRFHHKWFEAKVGYFYRMSKDGSVGSPLFDIGAMF